jgi:hypothetical protein
MPEVLGVPVDDNSCQQVQPGHTVMLTFGGTVPDFPLTTYAQSILQRVVRLFCFVS